METNNKLREALDLVDEGFSEGCLAAPGDCPTKHDMHRVSVIRETVKAALSAPPRNCDVGSVEEQKERFKDFCKEGKLSRIDLGAYCAYDCPCRDSYDCKLEWAQMPYEAKEKEGESNGR